MDEPKELGGSDTGMNPVEMLLCALGSCQAIVAKSFATAHGIDLHDFLVVLEGDLDPDGFLKGKPGVTIMIDGKIQPVGGPDLANMLKSMPSNSIDRIELISNPGARYDAAGTAGIINIRTKKDQRIGWSGSVNAS